MEATVGGLAYVYENQITDELQQTLNTTFLEHYGVDEEKTTAIDRMQQDVNFNIQVIFPLHNLLVISVYLLWRVPIRRLAVQSLAQI